jgi:hypothetical protein
VLSHRTGIRLSVETQVHRFDMQAWGLAESALGERQVPERIEDALTERTPQAILRDLHRPDFLLPRRFTATTLLHDPEGIAAFRRRKELIYTSFQAHRERFDKASEQAWKGWVEVQDVLEEPWEDSYVPEERRRKISLVPDAEHMRWMQGIDPDA